jgi:magnesium-transporting ATPase (P-type)
MYYSPENQQQNLNDNKSATLKSVYSCKYSEFCNISFNVIKHISLFTQTLFWNIHSSYSGIFLKTKNFLFISLSGLLIKIYMCIVLSYKRMYDKSVPYKYGSIVIILFDWDEDK